MADFGFLAPAFQQSYPQELWTALKAQTNLQLSSELDALL